MTANSTYITAREGAETLKVSLPTWYRLLRAGTLPPAIKLGACSRWRLADVLAAIDAAQTKR